MGEEGADRDQSEKLETLEAPSVASVLGDVFGAARLIPKLLRRRDFCYLHPGQEELRDQSESLETWPST